jgi:hypothetical protein
MGRFDAGGAGLLSFEATVLGDSCVLCVFVVCVCVCVCVCVFGECACVCVRRELRL